MKITYTIATITAVLVLAIALGAFVLSYDALRDLARTNSIRDGLAWIFPLIVDGFIVVASLAVLRNGLMAEPTLLAWVLVVLFVALSVAFNVIHASDTDLIGKVIAAVPPLALVLAFELLMAQVKSAVTRYQVTVSLHDLAQQVRVAGQKLEQRTRKVEERQAVLDDVNGQIKAARAELRQLKRSIASSGAPVAGDPAMMLELANATRQGQIQQRRTRVAQLLGQDMTRVQIADELGVSESTVKRDIRALNDQDNLTTGGSNGR